MYLFTWWAGTRSVMLIKLVKHTAAFSSNAKKQLEDCWLRKREVGDAGKRVKQ